MSKYSFPLAEKCKDVESRVAYIAQLMATGEWLVRRAYRKELAEIWGISVSRLQNMSSESSRWIRADPKDRDELRAVVAHRLLRLADMAETSFSNLTGQPDIRGAVEAIDKAAKWWLGSFDDVASASTGPAVKVVLDCDDAIERQAPIGDAEAEPGDGGAVG